MTSPRGPASGEPTATHRVRGSAAPSRRPRSSTGSGHRGPGRSRWRCRYGCAGGSDDRPAPAGRARRGDRGLHGRRKVARSVAAVAHGARPSVLRLRRRRRRTCSARQIARAVRAPARGARIPRRGGRRHRRARRTCGLPSSSLSAAERSSTHRPREVLGANGRSSSTSICRGATISSRTPDPPRPTDRSSPVRTRPRSVLSTTRDGTGISQRPVQVADRARRSRRSRRCRAQAHLAAVIGISRARPGPPRAREVGSPPCQFPGTRTSG